MINDKMIKCIQKAKTINQMNLDLSRNDLTSLPAEIGQLSNLTTLDLYGNDLISLPAEIIKFK